MAQRERHVMWHGVLTEYTIMSKERDTACRLRFMLIKTWLGNIKLFSLFLFCFVFFSLSFLCKHIRTPWLLSTFKDTYITINIMITYNLSPWVNKSFDKSEKGQMLKKRKCACLLTCHQVASVSILSLNVWVDLKRNQCLWGVTSGSLMDLSLELDSLVKGTAANIMIKNV